MKESLPINSLRPLYQVYANYKELVSFYNSHQNIKGETEIRERIDYIMKNGVKGRTEVETLCWILGENLVGEKLAN